MSREKQIYLEFKPMADDLRKAESWCEADGVLNRNKTMQNLYKMGYRKQSEGEWKEFYDNYNQIDIIICSGCSRIGQKHFNYCPNCGAKMKGGEE